MNQILPWSGHHYPQIFAMWQDWLAQERWQPVDIWLRHWQRKTTKPTARQHAQKSNVWTSKPATTTNVQQERLIISQAMFQAMRYLQLADALEYAYRQSRMGSELQQIDWQDWDRQWSLQRIQGLEPEAFWYWVGLRQDKQCAVPKGLTDAEHRKTWLMEQRAHFNDASSPDIWLLWNGLRPNWLSELQQRKTLSQWRDDHWMQFVHGQNRMPPLWLRAQSEHRLNDIAQQLNQEGVNTAWPDSPIPGLAAVGGRGLYETSSYKQGHIEIQDLASQQIALAVDVKPTDKVWDACAGAGGKTLAISNRMRNKGVVVATDLHTYKLDELKRRAKRAGFSNIRTFAWNGEAPLRLPQEVARQQGFDWVLLDAPCTASGTWRRNPDARWRFNTQDTEELAALQARLLDLTSESVRSQGYLVYATCSWHPDENEHQIEAFLNRNPTFELQEQRLLGHPELDSDTMFVAILRKQP